MEERTPGPWRIERIEDDEFMEYMVYMDHFEESERLAVCDVLLEADAHLIAAAPDLLEALKGVVAVADRNTVEFNRARAAIAKAENK